ncbi:TonB-dependent receptor [Brevundimonas kwangchunensis]|uniref:TonB-dependent receptor n=1 Tax=Brevundimonas kwangchunensis TaxID=322163 RepID=A0ABN1H4Z3_9CAUL
MAVSQPALAQARRINLNTPAQPVQDALLGLALQYQVTLGGDVPACRGTAPGLRGAMTLDFALTRTLAGSGCTFRVGRSGAVVITRAPAVRPVDPARLAPPIAPSPPPPAEAEVMELGDVIVTAERRPSSPRSAPTAVTAVTGQQIVASGAADTSELSNLVAGMMVTNLGSGRNKILLRGMSDGAFTGLTQSTVGLYLDQVPLTYSAPDPDLKLIDLDRVEILRGPQGSLYGTGPVGGVVRIITRRPDDLTPSLDLAATRSTTRGVPSSDYSAVANLPFGDGAGAIRAVVYDETFGGYIDDVSLNLRRVNDGSRRGARVSGSLRLGPDWTATVGVLGQSIDTNDTHYVYRFLGGLRRANLVREPHANDFDQLYGNLVGQGGWGRLEVTVARIDHSFASRYDASTALPAFGSRARIGVLDDAKDIDLLIGEATWTSLPGAAQRWTAGVFASKGDTSSGTDLTAIWPLRSEVYVERRHDELFELALFGETAWDLSGNLTLTAGGRLYMFDYETRSEVRHRGWTRPFDGSRRTTGFSPKLALDYRRDDRTSLYAQITQGHRTGGFNTAGPIGLDFEGGAGRPTRDYEGDSLWNYEIGAKALLLDDRLQVRVAAFVADWRDIQSDQFLPSGLAYAVNVGDGANRGVEIETAWQATSELLIRGNALLAQPRITRPSEEFNSRGDAGLPGVPSASANLNASWTRRYSGGLQAFASGQLTYVGPSRLTFDAERRHRMGDYVTGRIEAGVSLSSWTALVFVDNPLDTEANTFSFSDPFRLPQALATTPLRPRTTGVSLRLSL